MFYLARIKLNLPIRIVKESFLEFWIFSMNRLNLLAKLTLVSD